MLSAFASTACAQCVGSGESGPYIDQVIGTMSHGSTVRLSGANFGDHNLLVEWNGAWIESQTVGVNNPDEKTNWDTAGSNYRDQASISGTRAWSGTKSIKTEARVAEGSWQAALQYVHPTSFNKFYMSFWVYFEPLITDPDNRTQWKFIRINDNYFGPRADNGNWITPISDNNSEVYIPMYLNAGSLTSYYSANVTIHTALNTPEIYYEPWRYSETVGYTKVGNGNWGGMTAIDRGEENSGQAYAPVPGAWTRVEVYGIQGTKGGYDGEFRFSVQRQGETMVTGMHHTGLMLWNDLTGRTVSNPWKTIIWQNYWDSNGQENDTAVEEADFYMDDIYIQLENRARVMLGDASTFDACTYLEPQILDRWGDTQIRFTVNRGGFADGASLYIYVIHEDGTVSDGVPATLLPSNSIIAPTPGGYFHES